MVIKIAWSFGQGHQGMDKGVEAGMVPILAAPSTTPSRPANVAGWGVVGS